MTDYILGDENKLLTKESVLSPGAKLIKANIRELNISKSQYSNKQDIADIDKG